MVAERLGDEPRVLFASVSIAELDLITLPAADELKPVHASVAVYDAQR